MNSKIFKPTDVLPELPGVYNLLNEENHSLYIGVAENFKKNIKKILSQNSILKSETAGVEVIEQTDRDLIRLYAETIRRNNPKYNFTITNQTLYPHIKITKERFPRLLITRRIETDEAEYFGAFLPETGSRLLLGFLIDTFRLRGCDITIDGNLVLPCPQFYRKKCVAPCVGDLCDEAVYLEKVHLIKLFLQNNHVKLKEILTVEIQAASFGLDFETAAKKRDLLLKISEFFRRKDCQYQLNDAVDTIEIKSEPTKILIFLVTQRKRKVLGKRVFEFEKKPGFTKSQILEQVIWQFYQFHTPKEIRVPIDFQSRGLFTEILNRRAEREINIKIVKKPNQKITAERAFRRTEFENEFERIKNSTSLEKIQNELSEIFQLKKLPQRLEAFDVAHISGTDFVGAKSVWQDGKFLEKEYEFWFLDEKNELAALGKTIENRFANNVKRPDLILIDGGKSQLLAAIRTFKNFPKSKTAIISAVKPPQKHNEISHFLFENNRTVNFKTDSEAFRILLKLRDEAHRTANYIHRTKRETAHFFEVFGLIPNLNENERYGLLQKFGSLKAIKNLSENNLIEYFGKKKGSRLFEDMRNQNGAIEPFIVPIRYDDPNGEAENLQPLFLQKSESDGNLYPN